MCTFLSYTDDVLLYLVLATNVLLYPGRDMFEFAQGHVTNNHPITELVLFSESMYITKIILKPHAT